MPERESAARGSTRGRAKRPLPPWLHVLGLLALAAFFATSLVLLGQVLGRTSPWLALLLMFYFLALAKFAEPLVVLRMPRSLAGVRPSELEGGTLRRLGVLHFGRLLRNTPLRHLNARVYLDGSRADAERVLSQAASAEACHFWAAVLLTPFVVIAIAAARWPVVAAFLLAQILVNVYPILHLRHIRGRLERAMARSREAGGQPE